MLQIFVNGNAKNADNKWENNLVQTTSESLIKIDDLFQTRTEPNLWTPFAINITNGNNKFDLEF